MISFEEYEQEAAKTAIYPGAGSVPGLTYAALGLSGESGEVAEKVKKLLRDGNGVSDGKYTPDFVKALEKELGDVLWYLAAISREVGTSLASVADGNLRKLRDRAERQVLSGSGDNR